MPRRGASRQVMRPFDPSITRPWTMAALSEGCMNMLTVNLETARRLIEAVEAKARSIDCPVNIAVVDAGGNLVAHVRMDNARIGAIDIAINKAWTARAFDMDTAESTM